MTRYTWIWIWIWLLAAIVIAIVIAIIVTPAIEGFDVRGRAIVLMGDSVLNNDNYVPVGSSVYSQFEKYYGSTVGKILSVAEDGATVKDLYKQLDAVPLKLNKSTTHVFISIGGNDIRAGITSPSNLMSFIKAFKVKMGNAKLHIMNIYMPSNPKYAPLNDVINNWNNELVAKNLNVINLYQLVKGPTDFVHDIEPSVAASKKIAQVIGITAKS